jgi:enolase-phosphatase E1
MERKPSLQKQISLNLGSNMSTPVKAVILDIEGTVAPISFVKDVLFPYFSNKLPSILSGLSYPLTATSDDQITQIASQFPKEYTADEAKLYEHIQSLVANDVKDATLKALQGFVWLTGYEAGELKAPVYPDVIHSLEKWTVSGKKVYIYSSGSVKAQKLLFGYVDVGGEASVDLNEYLSGYFDITTSGYKQEKSSYENIIKDIGVSAGESLFLSDNENEIEAALAAGLQAIVVIRPGNAPLTKNFQTINNFHQLESI